MTRKIGVIVKILEARDISPVENKGELLDAFAQVRLAEFEYKTSVCRRSTCPVWREEIRIETDEKTLYEEPLQIRVLDHEAYSANDTVGGVLLSLVNLLNAGHPYRLDGWVPLMDPVHGLRGEIHLNVKIELYSNLSLPSCPCVLNTPIPPVSPKILQMFGVVDDVLVEADPETEWRDKLRSARASDDARQLIIARLAIELQQRVAVRASELGANAVVGYRQIIEADGVGGLIARGIGTAVWLDQENVSSRVLIASTSPRSHFSVSADSPFFTLTSYPPGIVNHIGGIVSARAVRITSDHHTAELYRRWFSELKREIKQQLDYAGYDAAIGYREQISIYKELVVVSASATAASLVRPANCNQRNRSFTLSKALDRQHLSREKLHSLDNLDVKSSPTTPTTPSFCSVFHVPYESMSNNTTRCQRLDCPGGQVSQILICSVDPPDASLYTSSGLLRTCITRQRKRESNTESAAKEVSDSLPYLEHELHRDMLSKMKREGWNAVFNLDVQLTIGEDLIILTGTGTGVGLTALPGAINSPSTPETPGSQNSV